MASDPTALAAHLKKYYRVDIPIASDGRIEFAWTRRNSEAILNQLRERFKDLPAGSKVLELASGSGEHLTKLAQQMPNITFYPTEGDSMLLPSIDAWIKYSNVQNVAEPTVLNFGTQAFSHPVDAAWVVNVTHISPWAHTVGLFTNLAQVLGPNAWLGIYGAFNRNGQFSSPSNKDFDIDLRERNSEWGIRDLETVEAEGNKHGFVLKEVHEMPANNLFVWFRRDT
ncbi:hypothetical protein K450DRAFT_273282 [Umbelopsis ramanniana AG]|uniref:Uncharacterized protein n=1 Tax=Umbelopsis ramanniana AG TaxID=1314678 RepID=A0AAD5E6Z1_UMBRA|nr:uncharacterized protein K450DRAFT_273282 [Umbelopsis ramanniana AG]KAI8577944.1 hypothetical protein K450DRAFT_273282 [Umbelopsis ramanniana AG]